jgi:hypothetical protein
MNLKNIIHLFFSLTLVIFFTELQSNPNNNNYLTQFVTYSFENITKVSNFAEWK